MSPIGLFIFFFQAEDGIRDYKVTGVQTCALPICWVEHHGEFYDFDKLEMTPTPTKQVPIYVGGISDPAFRRAARNDGWVSDMHTTEEFREIRKRLDDERAKLDRSDTDFA